MEHSENFKVEIQIPIVKQRVDEALRVWLVYQLRVPSTRIPGGRLKRGKKLFLHLQRRSAFIAVLEFSVKGSAVSNQIFITRLQPCRPGRSEVRRLDGNGRISELKGSGPYFAIREAQDYVRHEHESNVQS